MLSPNEFDATLRQWIQVRPFVPFRVELNDGQRISLRKPSLAFGGGMATLIDDEDGALVEFSYDQVIGFHALEIPCLPY